MGETIGQIVTAEDWLPSVVRRSLDLHTAAPTDETVFFDRGIAAHGVQHLLVGGTFLMQMAAQGLCAQPQQSCDAVQAGGCPALIQVLPQ